MPSVTVALGGEYVALHGDGGPGYGGGIRGTVRGFSRQSRKRLIDLIHQVDRKRTNVPLFCTLTYPREWPGDWREYKGHLHTWLKRLERRYPGVSCIWRLEYQQRGAPHYHLLVFGVRYLPQKWVSRTWFEVVGSGDDRHLAAGTEVATVRTWRGAAFYVSKYLGKVCQFGTVETGRMWGVRGTLPIELETFALTWHQWHRARRVLRRWLKRKVGLRAWWCSQRGAGITAYLPEGEWARVHAWVVAG